MNKVISFHNRENEVILLNVVQIVEINIKPNGIMFYMSDNLERPYDRTYFANSGKEFDVQKAYNSIITFAKGTKKQVLNLNELEIKIEAKKTAKNTSSQENKETEKLASHLL